MLPACNCMLLAYNYKLVTYNYIKKVPDILSIVIISHMIENTHKVVLPILLEVIILELNEQLRGHPYRTSANFDLF